MPDTTPTTVTFTIEDGMITEVQETGPDIWVTLKNPQDISDAVARVANAPVAGDGGESGTRHDAGDLTR